MLAVISSVHVLNAEDSRVTLSMGIFDIVVNVYMPCMVLGKPIARLAQ